MNPGNTRPAGPLHGALLLAGPASVILSLLALVLLRGLFQHGPGVPVAGRPEAWNLIWGCLGLMALGHVIGVPYGIFTIAKRIARRRPIGLLLGLCAFYDVSAGLAIAWLLIR